MNRNKDEYHDRDMLYACTKGHTECSSADRHAPCLHFSMLYTIWQSQQHVYCDAMDCEGLMEQGGRYSDGKQGNDQM